MKCQRCQEGESLYRVKSDIIDLQVCSWCAKLALVLNNLGGSDHEGNLYVSRQMDLVLAVSGVKPTTIQVGHA